MTRHEDDDVEILHIAIGLWPNEHDQLLALAQRTGVKVDALVLRALSAAYASGATESPYYQLHTAREGLSGFIGCAIEDLLEQEQPDARG